MAKSAETTKTELTIAQAIRQDHERSEVVISLVLIVFVALFTAFYFLVPNSTTEQAFEAFPYIMALYSPYLIVRLVLAVKRMLWRPFLILSCLLDVGMLTVLIWSFHLQYLEPAPFYLKAPTFTAYYLLIALRALASRTRYVIATGVLSICGWTALVVYAKLAAPDMVTHEVVEYMHSAKLMMSAEVERLLSLATVTTILAFAVYRTKKLLERATTEAQNNKNMSRFFSPEIASQIRATGAGIEPGKGEHRTAAILMMDLRGFTKMSTELPANSVMRLLAEYQSRMVAPIFRNGGTIDKFMGDGIMAHFGAASPSTTYAADCMRAVLELERACDLWNKERRDAGQVELRFGIACAVGDVIFGAVGDKDRLELTTIGDAVNLAAKLEKHTKEAKVIALSTETMWYRSLDQGYRPVKEFRRLPQSPVAGVPHMLNLVVLIEKREAEAAAA